MHILSVFNPDEAQILRSSCEIVWDQDFENGNVSKIVWELHAALSHYGNGVWLSAIQLWYPLQLFVINCRPTESFPNMKQFSQVIVNPVITHYSDETFDGREWCMSIADENCVPQNRYQVRRSVSVTFDYTDEYNIRHTDTTLSGISAVVFQHEYDHLFGRLIDQSESGQVITQEEYLRRKASREKMVLS